jgi:hypothetical protein
MTYICYINYLEMQDSLAHCQRKDKLTVENDKHKLNMGDSKIMLFRQYQRRDRHKRKGKVTWEIRHTQKGWVNLCKG